MTPPVPNYFYWLFHVNHLNNYSSGLNFPSSGHRSVLTGHMKALILWHNWVSLSNISSLSPTGVFWRKISSIDYDMFVWPYFKLLCQSLHWHITLFLTPNTVTTVIVLRYLTTMCRRYHQISEYQTTIFLAKPIRNTVPRHTSWNLNVQFIFLMSQKNQNWKGKPFSEEPDSERIVPLSNKIYHPLNSWRAKCCILVPK